MLNSPFAVDLAFNIYTCWINMSFFFVDDILCLPKYMQALNKRESSTPWTWNEGKVPTNNWQKRKYSNAIKVWLFFSSPFFNCVAHCSVNDCSFRSETIVFSCFFLSFCLIRLDNVAMFELQIFTIVEISPRT